jgi:type VI secretion system protein ImpK
MIDSTYWTTGEILSLGAQLAEARDLPAPDVLKRRIAMLLEDMEKRALEYNLPKRDIDDVKYAIVAFIDEQIFRAPWGGRQEWMLEPLQFVYFGENTAGEGFFQRLAQLEQEPQRLHVLQVYYLCLSLGFQGKYAVRGGEGLALVMERLANLLGRGLPNADILSPHGNPLEGSRGRQGGKVPVLALALGLVAVAVLVSVGLKVAGGISSSEAAAQMRAGIQLQSAPPAGRGR